MPNLYAIGIELVRGSPSIAKGGYVVGVGSAPLAEPRLLAGLKILMLDHNCSPRLSKTLSRYCTPVLIYLLVERNIEGATQLGISGTIHGAATLSQEHSTAATPYQEELLPHNHVCSYRVLQHLAMARSRVPGPSGSFPRAKAPPPATNDKPLPRQCQKPTAAMEDKNDGSPTQEPPIYKHLNPKTAAYLRQSNKARAEREKAEAMSNEQT